jgi:hypothetical protein
MLEYMYLTELFEQLLESSISDALDGSGKHTFAAMKASVDITANKIKKNNPESLDFFKLFGLLPGGVKQTDMDQLWGSKNWKQHKFELMKASMIVSDIEKNTLTLLPFMATRAYELLDQEPKKKSLFHKK